MHCGQAEGRRPAIYMSDSSMSIIPESTVTVQCVRYVQYKWTLRREALIRERSYTHEY